MRRAETIGRVTSKLTPSQRDALRHVDRRSREIEEHNAQYPLETMIVGCSAGTALLRVDVAKRLEKLGLIEQVARGPRTRFYGIYRLTAAGSLTVRRLRLIEDEIG